MTPKKVEIYRLGQTTRWQWRATYPDDTIEFSPETYPSDKLAKAIAGIHHPGAMLLVFK